MITYTRSKELYPVLISLITLTILSMNDNVYAHSSVDVNTSQNVNSNSNNTSTIKNTVKINGETIVDDETTEGNAKSHIEVKLENGEGTVKYTKGEDEKIIQITPKNNDSKDKDVDNIDEEDKNEKIEKNEVEINEKIEDTKARDLIEQMMKTIDSFFAKLSDLFN